MHAAKSVTRVRHIVHKGRVSACGLFFAAQRFPEPMLQRRILACWRPGARLYRLAPGYVLLLPTPQLMDTRLSPGAPLVTQGDFHTTAPLSEDEVQALQPTSGSVIIVIGGLATVYPCNMENRVEPSAWLDMDAYTRVSVSTLGRSPPPPVLVTQPSKPIRDLLGEQVPPAADEMQDLLQALAQMQAGNSKPALGSGAGSFFLNALAHWFTRSRTPKPEATPNNSAGHSQAQSPPQQTWLKRLLFTSKLGAYLGWRQAQYLRRMLDMFEDGDINNALRHAIPLSKATGANEPALGLPSVRNALNISPHLSGGSSGIGLQEELFQHLRQLYRRCFEQLDRAGRIAEAAFVLAELLQESEEAVSYLERHGQLRQAAELAESRELPPGLVVRQWFLAGDKQRAVAVARRRGAFADAVLRLERGHRQRAQMLRLLWARTLAAAGAYEAAIHALWPVERVRQLPLVKHWVEQVLALGGSAAGRMLARKLAIWPEHFTATREQIQVLLEDEHPGETVNKRAFAETLLEQPKTPEVMLMARPTYRSLLRDYSNGEIPRKLLQRLLQLSKDGVLRSDAATLERMTTTPLNARLQPLALHFEEPGTLIISDVYPLPRQRFLLALGEAGVRWIGERGQIIAHFEAPAHRLVVSEHGNRAIALAKRGGHWRLSRIDLDSRRSEFWSEASLHVFATDYDGSLWFIADGSAVSAIDAQAADFKALWRVSELPAPVLAMTRSEQALAFVVAAEQPQVWRYQLPDPTLRYRDKLHLCWRAGMPIAIEADASVASCISAEDQLSLLLERPQGGQVRSWDIATSAAPQTPMLTAQWITLPVQDQQGMAVYLFDTETGTVRAHLHFPQTRQLATRLMQDTLLIADDWGRLVRLDLHWGTLLTTLRV